MNDGTPETLYGLQLLALTFVRPGELRQAEWPESPTLRTGTGLGNTWPPDENEAATQGTDGSAGCGASQGASGNHGAR